MTTGLSGGEAGAPNAAQASRDAEPETGRNLDTSRDGVPSSHAAHLTPESFHQIAPMTFPEGSGCQHSNHPPLPRPRIEANDPVLQSSSPSEAAHRGQ
jgi:hypothetical protein